jgi:exonuclease VII small subunit
MAQALSLERPYTNLKNYLEYKNRGTDTLRAHEKEIANLAEDETGKAEEENQ